MNRRTFLKVAGLALRTAALAAAYSGIAEYSRALASTDGYPSTTLRTGIGADDIRRADGSPADGGTEALRPYNDSDGETEPIPTSGKWPALLIRALPQPVKDVLGRVQPMIISAEGILALQDGGGNTLGNVPLARTQWNKEKSTALDRLLTEWSWGIVLHWYGEPEFFDKTITGYLRGFDGLREANGYETRTSAHFLVGDALPATVDEVPSATLRTGIGAEAKAPMSTSEAIGILQTQAPDADGIPFVASHLRSLDYKQFRERQQYFVNALDALEFSDKGDHSILQDFYTVSKIDPGWRTIAIEMTGFNFDNPETAPGAQQMANVLGVIWAVMKRYKISALDVLGHNELSLDKADPGKLFMATIRYLLGVKALIDADEEMKELVFGRFLKDGADEYIGADEYPSAALRTGIGADEYPSAALRTGIGADEYPSAALRTGIGADEYSSAALRTGIGNGLPQPYRSAAYSRKRMLDAVGRYFKFVRDYLVLVSRPARVYAWEKSSQYWMLLDQLPMQELPAAVRKVAGTSSFGLPLDGKISLKGGVFLKPESHAGVDLFPEREQASRKLSGISEVKLAADGVCLCAGKNGGDCAGKIVIFRHREQEGGEILTIYSHLSELANLQIGASYPKGHILGKIASPQVFMERFLHFAVAYGATWETDLSQSTDLPMNAKPEWIKERFLDPLAYLSAMGR